MLTNKYKHVFIVFYTEICHIIILILNRPTSNIPKHPSCQKCFIGLRTHLLKLTIEEKNHTGAPVSFE